MCMKRPITSKTLLACTVVNTRWPVSLWHAPLGDVELGEHFHARDRLLGLQRVLDELHLRRDAVDAELDREARGQRLEVDVARANHQRIAQRGTNEAYHLARFVAD